MKVAALILGILAGLYGLSLAFYGSGFLGLMALGGMSSEYRSLGTLLLYAIPIAGLAGGGIALSNPRLGGALLLSSAAGWFAIGSLFGYGINFITIAPLALSAVGGLLAFGAASAENNRDAFVGERADLDNRAPSAQVREPPAKALPDSLDYRQLLEDAVARLSPNTASARAALYDRAREALSAQLGGPDAPTNVDRGTLTAALESAIRIVEARAAREVISEFPNLVGTSDSLREPRGDLRRQNISESRSRWTVYFVAISLFAVLLVAGGYLFWQSQLSRVAHFGTSRGKGIVLTRIATAGGPLEVRSMGDAPLSGVDFYFNGEPLLDTYNYTETADVLTWWPRDAMSTLLPWSKPSIVFLSASHGGNCCLPDLLMVDTTSRPAMTSTIPIDSRTLSLTSGSGHILAIAGKSITQKSALGDQLDVQFLYDKDSRVLIEASVDPTLNYGSFVGQSPEKVFSDPQARRPLTDLLGDEFAVFRQRLGVSSGVQLVDHRYLYASGCYPHNCGARDGMFLIDVATGLAWAFWVENTQVQTVAPNGGILSEQAGAVVRKWMSDHGVGTVQTAAAPNPVGNLTSPPAENSDPGALSVDDKWRIADADFHACDLKEVKALRRGESLCGFSLGNEGEVTFGGVGLIAKADLNGRPTAFYAGDMPYKALLLYPVALNRNVAFLVASKRAVDDSSPENPDDYTAFIFVAGEHSILTGGRISRVPEKVYWSGDSARLAFLDPFFGFTVIDASTGTLMKSKPLGAPNSFDPRKQQVIPNPLSVKWDAGGTLEYLGRVCDKVAFDCDKTKVGQNACTKEAFDCRDFSLKGPETSAFQVVPTK